MKTIKFILSIVFFSLAITSCTHDDAVTPIDNPQNAKASYDAADGVRGARLFDHSLNEKGITGTVANEHSNFFRCKTCHGWDLLGPNGVNVSSVGSDTKPAPANVDLMEVRANDDIQVIFDNIKNIGTGRDIGTSWDTSKKDLMPKFGQILSDKDIWDLVKFIKETAHDVSQFYDTDISSGQAVFSNIGKGGDPVAGLATYTAKCASCHGANGANINIYCQGEALGDMFRGDPHEIQHKAIWGMPIDVEHIAGGCAVPFGGAMPAQNITDQDIRNMMVMGQDAEMFPDYADLSAQDSYANADGVRGARLFDHPLNEKGITGTLANDHSNFFRCKSCHGWDLLGPNGINKFNVGSDTKPATAPVDLMEVRANDGIQEIFDAIRMMGDGRPTDTWDAALKDEMPKFGEILTDEDVWDLVKFIKETAHDVSDFYDMDISGSSVVFSNIGTPSKDASLAGDGTRGLATYTANCASCHGANGANINIYCQGEALGDMFRGDPHEIQHKAIWGMPIDVEHIAGGCAVPFGGAMPAQNITDQDIRDMMVMGQDATMFPDYEDLAAQAAAQVAYDAANGVRGARLFDHPLNEKGITGTIDNDHSNFFRCKSCHGWDLLGNNGINKFNVASLTKPATAPVNLMEVRANDGIIEIFNNIKNIDTGHDTGTWDDSKRDLMPKFGQILSDEDIWDLVKFIKETAHDVSDFYDMDISGSSVVFSNIGTPSKDASLAGDPVAGLATYTATCSGCHGTDGTGINIYCKNPPEYLGGMFRGDPHEIQHKAIWGMPIDAEHIASGCAVPFGGAMASQNITDQDIRNMMVMGRDEVAFPGI